MLKTVQGDKQSITIQDLSPDTVYYFKVQARNRMGYSPMSHTVTYVIPSPDSEYEQWKNNQPPELLQMHEDEIMQKCQAK